jgi:hypothetical protein
MTTHLNLPVKESERSKKNYTPRPVEITTISVDWGYKWADKFANLIEQYKETRSKENTNESYITL